MEYLGIRAYKVIPPIVPTFDRADPFDCCYQMWYHFNSNVFLSITAEVSMDVTQIKFVIFDVGQTLLFLTPSSAEVLLVRCQQLPRWINRQRDVVGCPSDRHYLFHSR